MKTWEMKVFAAQGPMQETVSGQGSLYYRKKEADEVIRDLEAEIIALNTILEMTNDNDGLAAKSDQ